jgi:uncharacterized protein YcbK (DUF882 family)
VRPAQWQKLAYFSSDENWGDPAKMVPELVFILDRLRGYLGVPIIVHCGYEPRDGKGYHPRGMAVDCHAVGLNVIQFFIGAMRFGFNGLGVYPWWNNPGLHLDVRPLPADGPRAIWGSLAKKMYVPFDLDFLQFAKNGLSA